MIKILKLNIIAGIVFLQPLFGISQPIIKRGFFSNMPEKQTYTYKPEKPHFYINKTKLDSTKLEVYLSELPFLKTKETNYYLFYIKESISTYCDSLLLSMKNDTLFVSASRVTRSTISNRSKLMLKNIRTLPLLDLNNYKFVPLNYNETMNHWFDVFTSNIIVDSNSIIVDKNETLFIANVESRSFSQRIHKIYFSSLRGIFKIDYY